MNNRSERGREMENSQEERMRGGRRKKWEMEKKRYKEGVKRTESQIRKKSGRCIGARKRKYSRIEFSWRATVTGKHIHKSHASVHPSICSSLLPPLHCLQCGQELLRKTAIHLLLRWEASINISTLFSGV